MTKQRQLEENINYLVGEYYNSMQDDDDVPALSIESCIDYLRDQIFDIKVVGSFCEYADGICDDLKFLGNDYIDKKIIELSEDILA